MTSAGQTLNWMDWLTLAAYGALLLGIALYHSRKIKARDDYLLAGRTMRRWPIAMSMYVALFSTNTLVGVIGWVNRPNGSVWIGLQNIGIVLSVPVVIALYPTIYFRMRITTAYEYLEKRFHYPVRALGGFFFVGSRVMWMSTMLYAGSLVISQMLGWTAEQGIPSGQVYAILMLGFVGMALGLIGGMHAIIWTDVVQFFVLFGSVAMMVTLAITRSGGFEHVMVTAAAAQKFTPPEFFSLTNDLSVVSGLCLGFVGFLAGAGTDQVLLQTYLTAKSLKEAKGSLWFSGLVLKPLSLIFPALGVIIFVFFHEHPDVAARMRVPDDALPVFVLSVLPVGVRGLAIAAIMSALLTSLEGGLTALTACIQVDYLQRWMNRPISDRGSVLLGRVLIFSWGILVTAFALFVLKLGKTNNIIQILNIVMYPFTGVLLGIFLLGLLTRRANGWGTLAGAVLGFTVTAGAPHLYLCEGISNFYYGALGALTTFAFGYGASWLTPADHLEAGR